MSIFLLCAGATLMLGVLFFVYFLVQMYKCWKEVSNDPILTGEGLLTPSFNGLNPDYPIMGLYGIAQEREE
jgi:hypothetical protein